MVVEGELPEYYGSLVDYIHLNPVRAGMVSGDQGQRVLDYVEQPWRWLRAETGRRPK